MTKEISIKPARHFSKTAHNAVMPWILAMLFPLNSGLSWDANAFTTYNVKGFSDCSLPIKWLLQWHTITTHALKNAVNTAVLYSKKTLIGQSHQQDMKGRKNLCYSS